MSNESIDS